MGSHFSQWGQELGSQIMHQITSVTARPMPEIAPIVVLPTTRAALSLLYPASTRPSFTMPEQAELVQSSLGVDHVLGVLPTGSGKTLAYFLPALMSPKALFVVVSPLNALTADLVRRTSETRIRAEQWRHQVKSSLDAQIIYASAHHAGTDEFYRFVNSHNYRLQRVFIEEAHHLYTSDGYRSCFRLFELLTRLGKPITFLSATIFPRSLPLLCKIMSIPVESIREIRATTSRPNIQYSVQFVKKPKDMMRELESKVAGITLSPDERGLIYCTRKADCRAISEALNIPFYVSDVVQGDGPVIARENDEEKTLHSSCWRAGETDSSRWMVATLCFGQGIDYPHVRWAIHYEVRNLMNFSQESGRVGRDGEPAYSHVIWSYLPPLDSGLEQDHEGVVDMRDFLTTKTCRRLPLGNFDNRRHSCIALKLALLCDNCSALATVRFFLYPFDFVLMRSIDPVHDHSPADAIRPASGQARCSLVVLRAARRSHRTEER